MATDVGKGGEARSPVEHLAAAWGDDAGAQGYKGPGWYFWDETGAYCHGPYATEAEAREKVVAYARALDCGHEEVEYVDGLWGSPEALVKCIVCGWTGRNGDIYE